jgi:protein-disulfide isomerase-like protein with CxxC motif
VHSRGISGPVARNPQPPCCQSGRDIWEGQALAELADVFGMVAEEHRQQKLQLAADTADIVHARRHSTRIPKSSDPTRIQEDPIHRKP